MASPAERLLIPSPEVNKFKPSQIDIKLAVAIGLDELIPLGYGFEGVGASAGVRAMAEFEQEEDRAVVYVAKRDGRAVGEIVTTKWTPEDSYGKKFWADLKRKNPSLYRRLYKLSPVGINISGITTHPDFRGQGLADWLYRYIVLEDKPSFFTGITKNPNAVIARAKILDRLGYRTFYGNTEVTPGKEDELTNVHQNLLDADEHARNDSLEEYEDGSDVFYIEGWLPKIVPDVSNFPTIIQKAFEKVIEAQKKANDRDPKKVAIKTLISIRDNIRLRAPEPETDPETESEPQSPPLTPHKLK